MSRQSNLQHLVVGIRRRLHECQTPLVQAIPGREQIVSREGDVLNAFAVVLHEELLDLPGAAGIFVERELDGLRTELHRSVVRMVRIPYPERECTG